MYSTNFICPLFLLFLCILRSWLCKKEKNPCEISFYVHAALFWFQRNLFLIFFLLYLYLYHSNTILKERNSHTLYVVHRQNSAVWLAYKYCTTKFNTSKDELVVNSQCSCKNKYKIKSVTQIYCLKNTTKKVLRTTTGTIISIKKKIVS